MQPKITYQTYLQSLKSISPALSKSRIEQLVSQLSDTYPVSGLLPHAPAIFVIDYSKGEYIFFSNSIGNYPSRELIKGGLDFMMPLMQPDFFNTYNEEVFPNIVSFLQEVPARQHSDHIISCNHRIKNTDGQHIDIFQRSVYMMCDETGLPAYCIGSATDISHFKTDDKVILSFEKKDTEKGVTQLIKRKDFHPYRNEAFLSEEEEKVLQYICAGLSTKMIAEKMYLSARTIEKKRLKLHHKTNTGNVGELVSFAYRNKIL